MAGILRGRGVEVGIQSGFLPDWRSVPQMLQDKLHGYDSVIALIGPMHGGVSFPRLGAGKSLPHSSEGKVGKGFRGTGFPVGSLPGDFRSVGFPGPSLPGDIRSVRIPGRRLGGGIRRAGFPGPRLRGAFRGSSFPVGGLRGGNRGVGFPAGSLGPGNLTPRKPFPSLRIANRGSDFPVGSLLSGNWPQFFLFRSLPAGKMERLLPCPSRMKAWPGPRSPGRSQQSTMRSLVATSGRRRPMMRGPFGLRVRLPSGLPVSLF